ncbi:hypothetical protein KY318_01105, partial [Candidatus Woesearchaeota archaeon]|nr:hypothetical protein [Candidatus Woesearchaeota archaeon]
ADEGIQSQTKQHLFLTKMLGVPRVAVALNKMDLVDYSQERFKQLKEMIEQLVERVGYNKLDVPIIPCSALEGENVVKRGNKMSWYKGQTLLEHIENLPEVTPPSNLALRLPVQDIYTIEGIPVVIGRIVTGVVKLDDKVRVWPSGREYSVERIYIQDKEVEAGEPGDNLYLYLKGLKQGEIKRGDMITLHNDKPTFATRFKAYVFIINHPTGIVPGYKTRFEMLTESTPCIINALLNKIDTTTGAIVEESPSQLQDKEAALVEIATSKPVYIEPQQHFSNLANFRLIEDDTRVGMGICVEVIE